MPNGKNIVLLTIECLRKKECSIPSNVPNLHRIAEKSLVYENFYSSSSWTPPSVYSIFTSKYPLMDEGRVSISKHDVTLAEILQKNGYYTLGLTNGAWLSRYFGFNKGFVDFYGGVGDIRRNSFPFGLQRLISKKGSKVKILRYLNRYKNYLRPRKRASDKLNSTALKWLNNYLGDRPFFLWIHYPETHEPYYQSSRVTNYRFGEIWHLNEKVMKDIRTRKRGELQLSPDEKMMLLDLYKLDLNYVDRKVGDLLEKLEALGYVDEDTYVFITGDHGQQFLEHGDFGHGVYLYQELCNVPLLIYNRNLGSNKREEFVSGVDIAPSILHLAGVTPPSHFLGECIFHAPNADKDIILQEGRDKRCDFILKGNSAYLDVRKYKISLVKNPYKIIINSNGQNELYNLEKDPNEQRNLANTEITIFNDLHKRLEKHLGEMQLDSKQRTRDKTKNLKLRGKI